MALVIGGNINIGGGINIFSIPDAANDRYFNQVALLLHGDGANAAQNNTFIDSSTNNFTVTRNGNTTQGTNTPFSQAAGYWSNYFNGTTDYLKNTNPAGAFVFGTSDFTVEYWIYPTSFSNNPSIIDSGTSSASTTRYSDYISSFGIFNVYFGAATYACATAINLNQWTHIAVTRSGTSLKVFTNGTQNGSTVTNSTNITDNVQYLIGAYVTPSNYLTGYMSNVRIVKGTAVYTANFTPSTTPLTAITNTSLLTCQSNRFVDNSSNNFTVTATGTPSVQPFSPFAPTSAYSTSVNGGSMYFDGTGDYLSVPTGTSLNLSGDFTIETYVYQNSNTSYKGVFGNGDYPASSQITTGITDGTPAFYVSNGAGWGVSITSSINILLNTWNHLAFTCSGSTFTLWVNGVSGGTATYAGTRATPNATTVIGRLYSNTANYYIDGIFSNLRVVKGTAVYTTTFTPPTAPLTAITNTSLLLSGTNAGIYDNAIKNDLETIGNAQVSTAVTKFGTGSMKFNGTTDYLTAPTSPQFAFSTGNWTIEGWVYPSSVTALQSLIDTRATATSTTGVLVSITALGFISVTVNNAILFTSSTAMTLSTWVHVAVVQNGTTITLYLNGTKPTTGSGTSSTSLTDQYLRLGASAGTAANFYNGYLDDVRITKGVARYTANFTPPTAAFPNQ